jgi:predicted acetyltransferase
VTSRPAVLEDCSLLAGLNHQLIRDEAHRNPMGPAELEARMRVWLDSGEYQARLFEDRGEVVAYALFRETADDIHLRQFFVVRHRRREGLGRAAMREVIDCHWPSSKRLTVSVLVQNATGVAFWRALGYADYGLTLEILPR